MSQAEELLKSMLNHTHPVTDSDARYVVNPVTKQVDNKSEKITIMQGDHNSERLTFEIPRYVDGHDMALCNATKVHYLNIDAKTQDQYGDVYDVIDLRVDPDNESVVICSWLISRYATQLAGPLYFIVQYACADDSGELVYEWHTDVNQDNEVKSTFNYGETAVLEYTDLLEQWRQRLFGAGDSILADITAEGEAQQEAIVRKGEETLATIPTEYTELYNMANEAVRTKADAIVLTEAGEVICVYDSSNDFIKNLKLLGKTSQATTPGKNLLKLNAMSWTSLRPVCAECSIDVYGVIRAKGTKTDYEQYTGYYSISNSLSSVKLYSTSEYILSGGNDYVKLELTCRRDDFYWHVDTNNGDARFTPPEDLDAIFTVAVYGNEDYETTAYPMVRLASIEDSTWEPCTGGVPPIYPDYPQELTSVENPTIAICGANLLDQSAAFAATGNTAEITKTITDDGLLLTGTPSKNYVQITSGYLVVPSYWRSHTMIFGVTIDGSQPHVVMYFRNAAKNIIAQVGFSESSEKEIHVPEDAAYYEFAFCLNRTTTGSPFTAKYSSMYLIPAEWSLDYEPYVEPQPTTLSYALSGINDVCDEIDFKRGMYIKRTGSKTFDGSDDEIWHDELDLDNTTMFRIEISDSVNVGNVSAHDFICDHFSVKQIYNSDSIGAQHTMKQFYFRLAKSTLSTIDLTGWRTWLSENPVTVQYVLGTPIETPLTEEEIAVFRKLKTNYHNTTVMNDAGAHMELDYIADTTIYIRDHQPYISDERLQAAVEAWLEAHYLTAEGVSF